MIITSLLLKTTPNLAMAFVNWVKSAKPVFFKSMNLKVLRRLFWGE